jgi:hypothetical protein
VDEPWQPANDVEQAMLRAARADDRTEYFRILTRAELYLPQLRGDGDSTSQQFVTMDLFGQTFLPVFTSLEAMAPRVAGIADAYTVTGYDELFDRWPVAGWRLAVNPGTPLDAYLPVEAVRAAADGDLVVPAGLEVLTAVAEAAADDEIDAVGTPGEEADLAAEFAAAMARAGTASTEEPDTGELLLAAAERGDATGYVDALLHAMVVLPTGRPVDDPARLVDLDFPWHPVGSPEAPVIEVFTSPERFGRAYPDGTPSLRATLVSLLTVWPQGHGLAVDPDSPAGITLPAEQVQVLLLWPAPDEDAAGHRYAAGQQEAGRGGNGAGGAGVTGAGGWPR